MSNIKGGRMGTLERWAEKVEDALKPYACGLTHAQVAQVAGMSPSTTSKALSASLKRGGVIFIRGPKETVWWSYEHGEIVRAKKAEMKAAAKEQNNRARSRANAAAQALAAFEYPMIQRTVKATEAPRLRPAGPASVWGLGA
jgi:hypothetical protein